MDITTHAKYIRMSPKRLRLVADVVRGMSVDRAATQLSVIARHATGPLRKLLHAAVANAEQNFDCVQENLYIKIITINEGPTLKRFTPRAFGRASSIRKRSAHLTLVVSEREEGKHGGRSRREAQRVQHRGRKITDAAREQPTRPLQGKVHAAKGHTHAAVIPGRIATRHHVEGAKENIHAHQKKSKGFFRRLFNRKAV